MGYFYRLALILFIPLSYTAEKTLRNLLKANSSGLVTADPLAGTAKVSKKIAKLLHGCKSHNDSANYYPNVQDRLLSKTIRSSLFLALNFSSVVEQLQKQQLSNKGCYPFRFNIPVFSG